MLTGIECLQWLSTHEGPVSSIEISRLMGVDRNRANRLLNSLVIAGFAEQNQQRKFRIGPGFHVLASQSLHASGILPKVLSILEKLHHFQRIVAFGVLWQDRLAYLYHHNPSQPISSGISGHSTVPATRSSLGLTLLAYQPSSHVRELYQDKEIPDFTDLSSLEETLA